MSEKLEIFKKIKELSPEPPLPENDIYFEREPWKNVATITCGICMGAVWRSDYEIENAASIEDLNEIYEYIKRLQMQQEERNK